MHLYFISGLGADKSVFQKLRLPSVHVIHHIEWIPFGKGESLESYARRLSAVINTSQPFALIGLSLGGMLAAEMSTFLHPRHTILISSAPASTQLPPWLRWAGKLGLHRLTPAAAYRWSNPFTYWLFGIRTAEEKALYRQIVRSADASFVQRAINAILGWRRNQPPPNLVHLHGEADRLLPLRYVKPQFVVKGGGHLAVFSRAQEVSGYLTAILGSEE